jgi:FKBP-type peptidyl-prolyl cis-trans isomerase SlyD
MDQKENKFIVVSYQLYSVKDGEKKLEEQTNVERPYQFISGFGVSLDAFEQHIVQLEKGSKFDFVISKSEAFGDYDPERVHKVSREMFSINGHFDHENIYKGAVITLMDSEEKRFMARVLKVEDDGVTIHTNHPLAGNDLNFKGEVLENRDATNEGIQMMIKHLSSEGCGCGCDDCGCDCGGHHHHDEGCGCGHCHH